jgi:hypothetical protein
MRPDPTGSTAATIATLLLTALLPRWGVGPNVAATLATLSVLVWLFGGWLVLGLWMLGRV